MAATKSDPTVEELLEELQDLVTGIPPEARPVVIKMAMEHVIHRYEQLMPLAPSGVEKEHIEMAMRDLRAQLAVFQARAQRGAAGIACAHAGLLRWKTARALAQASSDPEIEACRATGLAALRERSPSVKD
jgi:hypothetical protein